MNLIKNLLPKKVLNAIRPIYHLSLAFIGALIYVFPSRKITVVAVTGTKGKSTTTELISAILEETGFKTAVSNTLRFKVGNDSQRNLYKMTTPGRFFIQKFLRQAVRAGCKYAIIEMTSEGAKQFRHKFINFNALIFTNITPEHIESHGSYKKYLNAKLSIAKAVSSSSKRPRIFVVNKDDKEAKSFLDIPSDMKFLYSLEEITNYEFENRKTKFRYKGNDFETSLPGLFNIYNCLAAVKFAETQNIQLEVIKKALNKVKNVRGRVEFVDCGQNFDVVVDYAHTTDSLEKFYKIFTDRKKICILGNTGGGRDKWKRPEMGRIANENCNIVILTNEDPYDEDPQNIIEEMAVSIAPEKLKIILDRREAIAKALDIAKELSVANPNHQKITVLITGKGTDPFIMGPKDIKIPWDDADVVRQKLAELGYKC